MKNDLTCAVVRDLLPSYAEGLTAPETNDAVETHLADCPDCTAYLAAMRSPETETPPEAAREVDYLKKVKHRGRNRVILAILLTLLVLAGALAAKLFLIGSPASADTMAARTRTTEDGMLWVEVSSIASANAWWGWDTEVENGTARITARVGLVSAVHPTASGAVGIPLEGLEKVYLCGRLIWQDGIEISADTWALLEARTPYVGNASAVGHLLEELSYRYSPLQPYTFSLQTASQPYGLTLNFSQTSVNTAELNEQMRALAPLILALVDNLEQVSWYCMDSNDIAQNASVSLMEIDAQLPDVTEAYNAAHGTDWAALDSVKDYAASAAELQKLSALAIFALDTADRTV